MKGSAWTCWTSNRRRRRAPRDRPRHQRRTLGAELRRRESRPSASINQSGGAAVTGTLTNGRTVRQSGGASRHRSLREFDAAALRPLHGSVGLSGTDYLRGCLSQVTDLSIARKYPAAWNRTIQLAPTCSTPSPVPASTGRNNASSNTPRDPTMSSCVRRLPAAERCATYFDRRG